MTECFVMAPSKRVCGTIDVGSFHPYKSREEVNTASVTSLGGEYSFYSLRYFHVFSMLHLLCLLLMSNYNKKPETAKGAFLTRQKL